ncbi:MAG: translocation/assembly module TamB domain-containing protein, partial [Planctomycetota bacterium]
MMRAEKEIEAKPPKKTATRILKWLLVVVVTLIVLAFLLVPMFVSSQWGQNIILSKINNSLDGQADFGALSMSWWRGIKATNVSFIDTSRQTSVGIKQIATKPHYSSLLLGSLSFGETTIDEPRVEINLKGRQAKEFERPRQEEPGSPWDSLRRKKTLPPVLPIKKIDLVINDGNLKVTGKQDESVELKKVNCNVKMRSPGQPTNFDIDTTIDDDGKEAKIHTAGWIMPKRQAGWSLKGTSGNFTIEVNDLELESLGPILALAGIEIQAKGQISANIQSEIKNGEVENLTGTVEASSLDVTTAQLKGDRLKTSHLGIDVKLQRTNGLINIDRLQVNSDWIQANAIGVVPMTLGSLNDFLMPGADYNLKGSFKFDLAEIFSQIPRTLGVKKDVEISSGQVSGNIEASAGKLKGQATCAGLTGVVGAKKIALSQPVTAQAEITSNEAGVNFDKLNVTAAFAQIDCTGTLDLLKYQADVDLDRLQSELGQFIDTGGYIIAGELYSEGQLSSSEEKITVVGESVVKEFRLSSEEQSAFEPKADLAFAFDIDQKEDVVNVSSMKANGSFGQVSTKGAVLPLNKKVAKPVILPISAKVDLGKLQPFMVLLTSFPKEMELAGTAETNIAIRSEKENYRIVTDAAHIKNLKITYPGQVPFEQDEVLLILDAEVNPVEKAISVEKLQLISPQIKIHKGQLLQSTEGDKTKLEGQVEYEYDWEALGTVVGPFLPKGLMLSGQRKDTITFSSEYPAGQTDKILANLDTKAKLGFEQAQYMGLQFGQTEIEMQIQDGLLRIEPFSTTINNGKLNLATKIDLKQKPMVLQTTGPMQIIDKVEINEQVSRNLLVYLNPIFKDQGDITGIANFHSEKLAIPLGKDTNMQPEIIGTVGIENMKLETKGLLGNILSRTRTSRYIDAAVLPTKFVLRKGKLSYDNMQINLDKYPTNFVGSIGPKRILDMKVITPYVLTTDFKLETVKIDEESTAERFPLPLTGTIDNP